MIIKMNVHHLRDSTRLNVMTLIKLQFSFLSRCANLNELSIINSASYDQNTKKLTVDVCAIDEAPRFVYHLSENVVGYIIDNNLLEDKTRFVTIAFEE